MVHSLYIHVPFCPKKCVYCDFYSIPYDESLAHQYVTALVHEIEIIREKAGELSTVYIGGGTPTTLPTLALVRLMRSVRTLFTLSSDAEITIEANPGTITRESVEALVGAGINRMSIGIQSFDDNDLKMLGRIYDFQDALKALAVARHGGITNLGIDLIYGIPGQTPEAWFRQVSRAIEILPEHISAYELTIEDGTPLHEAVMSGDVEKPPDETIVSMYFHTIERLTAAGYRHYEISNFGLPGFQCRHNLNYWDRGEYLGAGAGAHSFMGGRRKKNVADVEQYLNSLKHGRLPVEDDVEISHEEALKEVIMLGLRKTEGVDVARCMSEFGKDLISLSEGLIAEGLLVCEQGCLRLTRKGLVVSNTVIATLFALIEAG
jgi:oxygen-independent coproporphyrinogen-3 oxidase